MGVELDALLVTDRGELTQYYADNAAAHIYALVDLDEPFWSASSWYRRGDAVVGLVKIPDDETAVVYAVSTRDPTGTMALIVDLLPLLRPGVLVTGPEGLGQALLPHRRLAWSGPHLRYRLKDHCRPPAPDSRLVDLDEVHAPLLAELYASDPGAAFYRPSMLFDQSFVGVVEDGRLLAAAGTHVLSELRGVAAVGAVYTRPSYRGRGLGRLVMAGVLARIVIASPQSA